MLETYNAGYIYITTDTRIVFMYTTCFESRRVKLDEGYICDATQYNSKGQIIWAESEDLQVSAFANRLIHALDVNKNAWSQIYRMVRIHLIMLIISLLKWYIHVLLKTLKEMKYLIMI